jgi:hypothetical protein
MDHLPLDQDRIHVANGTLYLNGRFAPNKTFCRNRLPVAYRPDAAAPETWLRFLDELLEPEDILTLQEYMGYCFLPTTRGQTMLLLKGSGGEGKSRIGLVMRALLGYRVDCKPGRSLRMKSDFTIPSITHHPPAGWKDGWDGRFEVQATSVAWQPRRMEVLCHAFFQESVG